MSPAPQSGDRRRPTAELRRLFQKFTEAIPTDQRIAQQLTAWSEARRQWRSIWTNRSAEPAGLMLQCLVPNRTAERQAHWVHPVADETPELDAWRTLWQMAARAEQDELAAAVVRAIAQIEGDPASTAEACAQLARSAGHRGFPLAGFTPALAALDPARFHVVCDRWLRTLGQFEGVVVTTDLASYAEINTVVTRQLAAAEGESPAPVLAGFPPADRFGMFFSWVVRTTSEATSVRAFDVTRKKYEEWPPMW